MDLFGRVDNLFDKEYVGSVMSMSQTGDITNLRPGEIMVSREYRMAI